MPPYGWRTAHDAVDASVEQESVSRRWYMWGIPAVLYLVAASHRTVPGLIAKDLMQTFDISGTLLGLLSATYFYAYAGLMIPGGVLVDVVGVRRVVGAGGLVMGVGTLAMGLAWSSAVLFAGRFVVGVGASVTFVGAVKIAANWFPPSQFGTLAALTATLGTLGSLGSTLPLAAVVAVAGWRGAVAAVGALTLVFAVLCLFSVQEHPPGASVPTRPPGLRAVLHGTTAVIGNRHTWPPFLAFFCFYLVIANLMLWLVPYLSDVYRLSRTEAAFYATAMWLSLLGASPLTGFVSDRVLRRRKLPYVVLTTMLLGLWAVFVLTLGTLPLPGVYALLFGMGLVGGAFVLTWPIGREVNPPHLAGVAVAVVNFGGFLGAAVTQGPVAALLDARWEGVLAAGARVYPLEAYRAAFSLCALAVFVSLVVSLFLCETRAENIYDDLQARCRRIGNRQEIK